MVKFALMATSVMTIFMVSCGAGFKFDSTIESILGFGWNDGINRDGILQINSYLTNDATDQENLLTLLYEENSLWIVGDTKSSLGGPNGGDFDPVIVKVNADTGALDTSFGNGDGVDNDEILQLNSEKGFDASARDQVAFATLTSDRKIILLGSTEGSFAGTNLGFSDFFVVRLDADTGELDTSFNTTGYMQFGTTQAEAVADGALDTSGNLYGIGVSNGNFGGIGAGSYDAVVFKLTSSGAFDTSFGNGDGSNNDGIVIFNGTYTAGGGSAQDIAYAGTLDSFGNLYLTGTTTGILGGAVGGFNDGWVAKMNQTTGLPDAGFGGGDGIEQYNTNASMDDIFLAITYDSSTDSLYVGGYTASNFGAVAQGFDAFIAKIFASTGSLDPTFGNNDGVNGDGVLQLSWILTGDSSGEERVAGLLLDGNGSLFAVGKTESSLGGTNDGGEDAFILKLNTASGTLDSEFGSNDERDNDGILHFNSNFAYEAGSNEVFRAVIQGPSGEIYVGGNTQSSMGGPNGGNHDLVIIRAYLETGELVKDE